MIFEELRRWDETKADHQSVAMNPPVRTTEFLSSTRSVLLQHFIRSLSRAIIQQDALHITSLDHILADKYTFPIKCWPLIELKQHKADVTGFRNERVSGGDGMDFSYYFFPEFFVGKYGKEAARKEQANEPD